MDDLLQQGVTAYRAGNRDEARKYFIAAIKQNQNDERVWGWMYNVANNDQERKSCLEQMLRLNPKNEKAKSLLNDLVKFEPPLEKPENVQIVQPKQDIVSKSAPSNSSKQNVASSSAPKTNQKNLVIGCSAILAVIFVCVLSFAVFGNSEPNTPDKYVAEYGGNRDVYVEILALTDCKVLQEKFDTASANNARETAGTPQFKWTLGYMTAADNRMKEIGCYK